jgi:hypothetical protein
MITIPPKSPRVLSAIWFAFVAYIVVLIIFRSAPASHLFYFFLFQVMPIITGGLIGFSLGHQIMDSEMVRKPIEASVIGIKASVITYFAYFLITYLWVVISSIIGGRELRIDSQIYSFVYITFYYGWLIIVAGAAAGWLLYKLSHQKTVSE